MLSGGALGSLTVGLVTCYTWEHGLPKKLSHGPSQSFSAGVERVMAKVGAECLLLDGQGRNAVGCSVGQHARVRARVCMRLHACTGCPACVGLCLGVAEIPHMTSAMLLPRILPNIPQVWNWLMEPILFATIGTSIVFDKLPASTIPKSLLVVCTGMHQHELVLQQTLKCCCAHRTACLRAHVEGG